VPDLWTRREFNRTLTLAVIGSIFVPKFGRWFQPNRVIRPSGPPMFVGHSGVDWPAHRAGDVAILIVATSRCPEGWTEVQAPELAGAMGMYWRRAETSRERAPRLARGDKAVITTFRGVTPMGDPFAFPKRSVPEFVGYREAAYA
jgi:hypothetical protein